METTICKNCGNEFTGDFCNLCGQKARVRRIDVKYFLKEVPNSLFQVDRGFFYTVRELFIRPGHAIRHYLEGKRAKLYKPVAYFLVTATLYFLTAYLLERNTFVEELVLGISEAMRNSSKEDEYGVVEWVTRNQVYFTLSVLPISALASYLAFVRSRYNYFEHLVLNVYITAQQMIIYFSFGFFFSQDSWLIIIPNVMGFVFNYVVYVQFFRDKKVFTKIMLTFLANVFFLLMVAGLLYLLTGVTELVY